MWKPHSVSKGLVSVPGYCIQTCHLRDKPHQIDAVFCPNGHIRSVVCSCKAGQGEPCKHILATSVFCSPFAFNELNELSSTDKACVWKDSFKDIVANYINYYPLLEPKCFTRNRVKERKMTEVQREMIKSTILQELPNSAFSQQVKGRHRLITFIEENAKTIDFNIEALEAVFLHQRSDLMENIVNIPVGNFLHCCHHNSSKL